MAKEKQARRMIAMALAAAVTMSSVPVVAFAEDGEGGATGKVTVTVTAKENTTETKTQTDISTGSDDGSASYEGHKTETSVTTGDSTAEPGTTDTTATDIDTSFDNTLADGEVEKSQTTDETTTTTDGTTTTVVNEKTENYVDAEGNVVDKDVTTTTTTTTDADGNVIETTTEDGSETTVTKEDVAVGDKGQPEVKVELEPGEKVTSGAVKGEVVKVESSLVEDGDNWESKEVISEIERIVQAELSKETTKVETDDTTLESIAPEDYDGKHYDTHEKITGFTQPDGLLNGLSPDYIAPDAQPEGAAEEGYNYYLSGTGDATWAAAPVFKNIVYVKDPVTGEAMKDADGNYIIDEEKSQLVYAGSKAGNSGMNGTPGQIVLKDENGELFYTYCIDKETPTNSGSWYKVSNLEDSDYYPDEESANKLRAIVEAGYWGTAEGTGSLESVKQLLRDTYDADDTVTVKDAKGNEHTYNVVDLIDGLKEHEALAVTQGAIWSYANGSLATQNGQDGVMVIGVQSAKKFFNGKNQDSPLNQYAPAYHLESDAIMKALYDCMMGLEGKEATDVVINENNSVDNMTLVVGDKAVLDVEDTRNTDDDADNDVYNTSVEFTLAFVPDKDDNIHVYVLDKDGNQMNDANGDPIVRKLAAEGNEEDGAVAPVNGVYTLSGLVFQENTNVEFSLQLKGMQNLDQGVYIYQAYDMDASGNSRNDSQTLVGIAGGTQDVTVTKSMELTFNVDEEKTVTATSRWHKSSSKTTPNEDPGEGGGNGGGGGGDNPPTNIPDEDVPLSDIPDEDVPLADIGEEEVPLVAGAEDAEDPMVLGAEEELIAATGDNNHMTAGFGGMLAALAGMLFCRKKKEN